MALRTISLFVALLAALCFAPASAVAQQSERPAVVVDLVAAAKESIRIADMDGFEKTIESKDFDLVIDVREPSEYAAGHVAGAINIPRGVLEFKVWEHVGFPGETDTGKKIYVYCRIGSRAALSAKSLGDLGFTNVSAVDMKIDDWAEAGLPFEKSD